MIATEAREWLGVLVDASLVNGDRVSKVLRFVTPDGHVVLAERGTGQEQWVPLDDLESLEDARTDCSKCGAHVNNTFPDDEGNLLCVDHHRQWAWAQPAPVMECPECSTGAQAFWSPRRKRWACASCHGVGDGLTGLAVEARFLAVQNAACRAQPEDDSRHDWVHVRGHRWHCQLCLAKRFTDPPSFGGVDVDY